MIDFKKIKLTINLNRNLAFTVNLKLSLDSFFLIRKIELKF